LGKGAGEGFGLGESLSDVLSDVVEVTRAPDEAPNVFEREPVGVGASLGDGAVIARA
jgi:hypothetical protein